MPRRRAQEGDGQPVARKKPGPKPGSKRAAASAAAPTAPTEARPLHDGARPNAFRTGVNIDALVGDALRAYARHIGLTERDASGLSEERLRMNCKARLSDMIETFLE